MRYKPLIIVQCSTKKTSKQSTDKYNLPKFRLPLSKSNLSFFFMDLAVKLLA